jgi:NAD(P)-dependent dehydrogenase (short-subunit alcohol dehydrogenase family)
MGMLEGNVTLLTGGGSGLGRAIVSRFVSEGANVAVLERSPEKAEQLTEDFGGAVEVVVGDVSSPADNERAVASTVARFGRLDTFIGNAGVWDFNTPLDATPASKLSEAFDQLFGVNVKGFMLGARAAVDELRKSSGSMIFSLSNAAFLPGGGGPLYVASKHAGVGLVRQLAYELEDEVRVNAVAPGGMSTDLRGVAALDQDGTSFGEVIESMGGTAALASAIGRKFFPEPDDYVIGYVVLACEQSRTTTGAIFEMHGMLSPPPRGGLPK